VATAHLNCKQCRLEKLGEYVLEYPNYFYIWISYGCHVEPEPNIRGCKSSKETCFLSQKKEKRNLVSKFTSSKNEGLRVKKLLIFFF
jgi:hypothetical protein